MKSDSIQNIIKGITIESSSHTNLWLYIAAIELICILLLLFRIYTLHHKNSEKERLKQKVLKENEIDFENVINSSFKAKELYNELKGKCHPDKFAKDEFLNAKATEIFSLLVKNKYNYKMLCELKERAQKELNINF